MFEFEGQRYECLVMTSPDEPGRGLELNEARPGDEMFATGPNVLWAFYSDVTGRMTVNTLGRDLPVALVEWFIAEAKGALPPASSQGAVEPAA